MPLFVAVHKWKPQDDAAITKESNAAFAAMKAGKTPKGVTLHHTWGLDQGAYCVWEADSKEALEKAFDKVFPILKKYTEFVSVRQVYPAP